MPHDTSAIHGRLTRYVRAVDRIGRGEQVLGGVSHVDMQIPCARHQTHTVDAIVIGPPTLRVPKATVHGRLGIAQRL